MKRCEIKKGRKDHHGRTSVVLYTTRIQIYTGTWSTDNDDFHKRTNTLLYKNINLSHFIFEKVMFVVCEWRQVRTAILTKVLLSTIAALLSHLGLGCSTGDQSPQSAAGSHFDIPSPTDSNRPGTWLYYFLTSTYFRSSSAYLHRCMSWLTSRSRVNI